MSDSPAMLGVMAYGRAAARLGRASRAAVLSKEGASPRRILLETGYQRGPYGWGVETRGDVYMKPASVLGARPYGALEEMADVHPDVERAYPGIGRDLRVEVVPDNAWADRVAAARKSLALWASKGDTASGFYDRGNHLIAVRAQMPGESLNGYIDRADGTVTHEVQHYAQERDGLRPGGPRRHVDADDYREDGIEVDARNSAARRKLTPEERREIPRLTTQDVKPEDVRLDDKGGDNFGTFRNFLATDDVPESIFGYPVVQDESQYTEKDLEFFRKNPKAAGFYDLGDEEMEEDVPQQAAGAGDAVDEATLTDDRPMYFFRDDGGKITGYGTTRSIVHEDNGKFFVIPTIIDNGDGTSRLVGDDEAVRHFRSTREHWGGYADRRSAEAAAGAVHERHQRLYGRKWNDYIQNHWDEMSDEIRNDPGVLDARHARTRGAYPGKLNNPGNVEKRKERRRGEVDSPSERFAKFATPQDGLREMADAIRQIAAVKLAEKGQAFTVRNFAEVYAPRVNEKGEKENDTDKYIADISADSGFGPDAELHRFDEDDMARLLKSVVKFESGAPHSAWFTDEEYAEAAKKLQEGAVD